MSICHRHLYEKGENMSQYILMGGDIEPLLEGLTIFGTGGGGSPLFGKAIMENDFKKGRKYVLVDAQDIKDDALVVSGGIMGSVGAIDTMDMDSVVQHWEERFELAQALEVMEELLGKKVDYLVPFELGGLNTPVILSLGARAGIPVINGDGLGRAAPETQMTSFLGHGISLTPMPLVDDKGNVIIVKDSQNIFFPDQVGRWMITNAGGMGANNHYPMSGKQLKFSVVPGTVTKALKVGKAIINSQDKQESLVDVVSNSIGGHILFRGIVGEVKEEDRGGFLHKVVVVKGIGRYSNRRAKLIVKNEVMLCQVEKRIACIFPDLIIILSSKTGKAIMSSRLRKREDVSIIVAPCHSRLREALKSSQGKSAFSPARFGYEDLEYSPLEQLCENRDTFFLP